MKKVCSQCNIEKEFTEFSKRRTSRDGYHSQCKKCRNQYNKQYRIKNREQKKEYNKQYRIKNKEQLKEGKKQYYIKNKEQLKEYNKQYRIKNKEQRNQYNKQYHIKNREQRNQYNKQYRIKNKEQIREYTNNRLKTDPLFALKNRIRCLIRGTITNKGYTKKSKTHEILGIDWVGLKEHMERQFTKGMNWENRDQWHIDHIIPLATAQCEDDIIKLNHYTNLQPLWAEDNLSKGSKLIS
jgi:hypothetical protein